MGVEIDEGNIALCRKNIAPWSERCRLVHAAVWHEAAEVSYGGARESGYAVLNGRGGQVKGRVRGITLDTLIDQFDVATVDYVKMDIEGAEKAVLADATRWANRVRCLKVEVHPEKVRPHYPIDACREDLERHGFRCSLESRHESCIIATRKL
jgi:FkbM family methyltransferase